MWKALGLVAIVLVSLSTGTFAVQDSTKVDFARDVQPLLRQSCVGCHGPTQQMNGFRLDRRRDAMRGGTITVIGPGNAQASRLYLRLLGDAYGPQMPPTGALRPEQIATIKAWIDQGAEWPDELANDVSPVRLAPLQAELMNAALWGNAASVTRLLGQGADPNVKNEAGATALMWAVTDLDKTRVLLDHGANVNARSDDGRTPLLIAAGFSGGAPVVKLLLDRGASVSAQGPGLVGNVSPLVQATLSGDEPIFRLLLEHGADVNASGPAPLGFALRAQCQPCVATLLASMNPALVTPAMMLGGPPLGPALATTLLLGHGADPKATDPDGRTTLMLAAASDALPADIVKALIDRGVDVNAKSARGETALSLAQLRGQTVIVDLLRKAGAQDVSAPEGPTAKPSPALSARAAVERSLPLLQQNDVTFLKKAGCVSCHNNTLTAMTVAAARDHGLRVNDDVARRQLKAIGGYLEAWRERALQGMGIPGDSDTVGYILLGMAAEKYPADPATDAMARFLRGQQVANGQWRIFAHRPPLESNDIEVTAVAMRALQMYAPATERAKYRKSVQLAAAWLAQAPAATTEERAFQLLGLGWSGARKDAIRKAGGALVAQQRPDGGWAQLPSLTSDSYATGQALVALVESGALTTTDAAFARGVQFLLRTQFADGSWFVKSRAIPLQPHFESGFPYGRDQFISAAASNWATMALTLAAKAGS